MAFPQPVPSLSEEQYAYFRQQMEEFEASEEMEADIERHRKAIREDA